MNPFREALELFGDDGEHWIQHKMHDREGGMCARYALGRGPYNEIVLSVAMLGQLIAHELPTTAQNTIYSPTALIEAWNDRQERTWEDVQLMFKRAAERWDEVYA